MMKTARDFELPDVYQKLAQLKVEVSLPSSQIGWIDIHGQGMTPKKNEDMKGREKRRRVRRQHVCQTLTSIISNFARHHYHVHHSFFSFHLANHHLQNLFDSVSQYAFLAGKIFDHSLHYICHNLFHHPSAQTFTIQLPYSSTHSALKSPLMSPLISPPLLFSFNHLSPPSVLRPRLPAQPSTMRP